MMRLAYRILILTVAILLHDASAFAIVEAQSVGRITVTSASTVARSLDNLSGLSILGMAPVSYGHESASFNIEVEVSMIGLSCSIQYWPGILSEQRLLGGMQTTKKVSLSGDGNLSFNKFDGHDVPTYGVTYAELRSTNNSTGARRYHVYATVDGLAPGSLYQYRLVWTDAMGNKWASTTADFHTLANPPTKVVSQTNTSTTLENLVLDNLRVVEDRMRVVTDVLCRLATDDTIRSYNDERWQYVQSRMIGGLWQECEEMDKKLLELANKDGSTVFALRYVRYRRLFLDLQRASYEALRAMEKRAPLANQKG